MKRTVVKRCVAESLFALACWSFVGCGGGSTTMLPTNTGNPGSSATGSASGSGASTGSTSGASGSGSTAGTGSASGSGSTGSGTTGGSSGSGSGTGSGSGSGGQSSFMSQTYDLGNDFSFANSANGVWQYGYSATPSLAPDQFRPDTFADTSQPGTGFWHPTTNVNTGVTSGYYPYVAKNTTNTAHTDPSNGWAVRPGEVAMEGSGSGQYSLVRFIAPAPGKYQVTANFEGIHFNLSTTDVHVLQNGTSLFDFLIDGYGGDPSFHPIQGAHPQVTYSSTLALNTGDILTFAVGLGANQTVYNDTTGLFVHIVTVP